MNDLIINFKQYESFQNIVFYFNMYECISWWTDLFCSQVEYYRVYSQPWECYVNESCSYRVNDENENSNESHQNCKINPNK